MTTVQGTEFQSVSFSKKSWKTFSSVHQTSCLLEWTKRFSKVNFFRCLQCCTFYRRLKQCLRRVSWRLQNVCEFGLRQSRFLFSSIEWWLTWGWYAGRGAGDNPIGMETAVPVLEDALKLVRSLFPSEPSFHWKHVDWKSPRPSPPVYRMFGWRIPCALDNPETVEIQNDYSLKFHASSPERGTLLRALVAIKIGIRVRRHRRLDVRLQLRLVVFHSVEQSRNNFFNGYWTRLNVCWMQRSRTSVSPKFKELVALADSMPR